ncbi:hypothetical protein SAMN02745866_04198 [Alteromonadaceae bacterium Bs31]|nr:hypothetical protein SAMN02745866_04198 [Alteromonadaceae bacterium Bs31]
MKFRFLIFFLLVGLSLSTTYLVNKNSTLKSEISGLRLQISDIRAKHSDTIINPPASTHTSIEKKASPQAVSDSVRQQKSTPADCYHPEQEDFVSEKEKQLSNIAIQQKYQLLLGSLNLSRDQHGKISSLLTEREDLLNMNYSGYFSDPLESEITVFERDQKLEELDKQVAYLLDEDSTKMYELLKDSGFEQYQVQEFDQALPSGEFLSEHQSKKLLLAKLNYKNEYESAINNASKLVEQGQQEEGFRAFEQAIDSYKNSYLNHARAELSESQYSHLEAYEEENFGDMLSSLTAPYEDRAFD